MIIKSRKDFWSGLLLALAGAAFAVGATSYSFGSGARPGPGYFPFGLGVLLALLGTALLIGSLYGHAHAHEEPGDPVGHFAWRPLLTVVSAVVLFGFGLERLGLFITLPLTVLLAAYASEEFRWHEALFNAAVLTVGSWLIFVVALGLLIPLWPTGWFTTATAAVASVLSA